MSESEGEKIGVVGLGLLGRGIAAAFLGRGYHVVGYARNPAEHDDARPAIERMAAELTVEDWRSRWEPVVDFAGLRGCTFIAESVTEDVATKESVYRQVEAVVGQDIVIASNTSAIPISILQTTARHPARFVGMHWAEPAHTTRFIELIRGDLTSDAAFERTAEIARRLHKEPTLCRRDVPGFIVNRIGYAMYREALHLVDSGVADIETVDHAIRNTLGLWATLCGPMRWMDLSGGPELYARAMERVLPTLCASGELSPTLRKLAVSGARGITNGRGFYEYTPAEAHGWKELHHHHAARASRMIDEYFPLKDESAT